MGGSFLSYYQKYKNKIFNYFWYRTGFNQALAEDLTADVFLKAYEARERFDPSRPFQAWIFRIAHNHLVNYYRSRRETAPLGDVTNVIEVSISIEEKAGRDIEVQRVLKMVSQLPEQERDLILWRYVDDLSNQEIAEILGKEEGAVRTALSRVLSHLRELLGSEKIKDDKREMSNF